jgi:hypothetical protein
MNTDDVTVLQDARRSLVRQRTHIARRLASIELAPISIAEDLTKILVAIEAVDRTLADAGHPYFDVADASAADKDFANQVPHRNSEE